MDFIAFLFQQVKEIVEFADNVNESYSPSQVLHMTCIFVFNIGQLNHAYKK